MKTLSLEVPHTLGREPAKKRMEQLILEWQEKYGIHSSWVGDVARISGKALGIELQATLEVQEDAVRGVATDPGMLLRHRARKYLLDKLALYLDPLKTPGNLERHED